MAIASPTAAPDTPPIPTTATRCQRVPAVATAAVVGAVLLLTPTITATAGVATGSNRPVAAAPATGAAGGHLPPSRAADPSAGKRPPPVTAAASPPVSHSLRGMRRPPPPPARTTDDGDPSLSARLAPARPGPMDATVPSVQRDTTDPQPGQEVRTVAAEGGGGCTHVDGACIMMGEEQGKMQRRLGKGAGRRGGSRRGRGWKKEGQKREVLRREGSPTVEHDEGQWGWGRQNRQRTEVAPVGGTCLPRMKKTQARHRRRYRPSTTQ